MFKKYSLRLYLGLALAFTLVLIFNFCVDPYALFNKISITGFNQEKPALVSNLRAYHIRELQQKKPQALILGSSRAQLGLNAKHKGFDSPAYNLGMPLATIDEMADYFAYANQLKQIKQAVIAIDFFSFNVYLKSLSPFQKQNSTQSDAFSTNDKISALIGYSGLKGSMDTIRYNRRHAKNSQAQAIDTHPDFVSSQLTAKTMFDKSERFYLERKVYLPYPYKKYSLVHEKNRTSSLAYYQNMLQTCEQNKIDCNIVILPVHARQLELMHRLGLWDKFEAWKLAVVRETNNVAPNLPVFDFTGYGKVQTERLPELTAQNQKMHYFIDSAHITPQLGDEILDWVLLAKPMKTEIGVRLTLENIQSHLSSLRAQRECFVNANPQIVAEIDTKVTPFTG